MKTEDLYALAEKYGNEMELYGKSLYWTSPRVCNDTTTDLKGNVLFQELSYAEQKMILDYGYLRQKWGMGCYQEKGFNAEMYSRGIPPKNPFVARQRDGDER